MTPLAPLGAPRQPSARVPQASALAAFAKTRTTDESTARSFSPSLGAVRPLAVAGGLAPLATPPGDVSALAAFAKKVALPSMSSTAHSPLDRIPSESGPKRPTPLPLGSIQAPPNDNKASKAETTAVGTEAETKRIVSESKTEVARDDSACKAPTAADQDATTTEAQDDKATSDRSQGTNDGDDDDDKAEFACMESSSEEEGETNRREAMDVEDLYDHDDDERDSKILLRAKERIFVPPTAKNDLFHAILTRDLSLLTQTLSQATPQEVLAVRDGEGRTMYHYAAVSRSPEVQAVVFDFISCFLTQESHRQVAAIESKQRRVGKWMNEHSNSPNRSEWTPPSLKQIQESTERELVGAYLAALRAYDCNERSFLHYSTLNHCVFPTQVSRSLTKVLKSHCGELLRKDVFERDPLVYAVIAGNTRAIELWFAELRLGELLTNDDISRLTQLSMNNETERVLYKLLEDCDSAQHLMKQPSKTAGHGLGVQFLTKYPTHGGASSKAYAPSGTRMWTTLHKAAVYGNVDAVRHFIDLGASVNEHDADGWTPLHHCSAEAQHSSSHFEIAEILLNSGADVNAKSLHGRTPLHLIAMYPLVDNVEEFSVAAENDSTPCQRVEFAMLLCRHGAKLELSDEDHYTPFLAAVRAGHIRLARFLLESNCDSSAVDKAGRSALHIAVIHNLESMTAFLCWWDAQYPVWRFMKDYQGRLPKTLAQGDRYNQKWLDNLWYSVRERDVDQVRQQLRRYRAMGKHERARHISIHDRTAFTKRTALHIVIEPFLETMLLSATKPVEPKGLATSNSSQDAKYVVIALLEEGASVGVGDKWAITPLMLAACIDSPLVVEAMLKYATEKDVTQRDSCGNTAIHYSYAFSRARVSSLLEDVAEDADIENNDGRRPLQVTGFRDKIFPSDYRAFLTIQRSKQAPKPVSKSNRK